MTWNVEYQCGCKHEYSDGYESFMPMFCAMHDLPLTAFWRDGDDANRPQEMTALKHKQSLLVKAARHANRRNRKLKKDYYEYLNRMHGTLDRLNVESNKGEKQMCVNDRIEVLGAERDEVKAVRGNEWQEIDRLRNKVSDLVQANAEQLRATELEMEKCEKLKVTLDNALMDYLALRNELTQQWASRFHGCLTGDCTHSNAHECLNDLVADAKEMAESADAVLKSPNPGQTIIDHIKALESDLSAAKQIIERLEKSDRALTLITDLVVKLHAWNVNDSRERMLKIIEESSHD